MSLIPYYLQFVSEICEGKRPLPEGFALHETDDLKKAVELQTQIQTVGIPEFVRRCAAQTGESIPQADYDAFDPNDLNAAIAQLAAERAPEPDEPAEPAEPVKTETRDIFEVFLDSVCLEDEIFRYLIDILRRGADGEFRILSRAAARTELSMEDFLAWLGNRELLGSTDEQACVRIMDGCLEPPDGRGSGRSWPRRCSPAIETTFELFRTEAPELVHLPDATYEWYCKILPRRLLPRPFHPAAPNGVAFPAAQ